jgi:hypothetical protein
VAPLIPTAVVASIDRHHADLAATQHQYAGDVLHRLQFGARADASALNIAPSILMA